MLLLLKAQIKGGASGDLFGTTPSTAQVRGHVRGSRFIRPYQATRHKGAPEPLPEVHVTPPKPMVVVAKPAVQTPIRHEAKGGFPTIEAARDDLKKKGFTAAGPYAKEWTHPDGTVFILGNGSLKGKVGQSSGGGHWVFGYRPKTGEEPSPKPVMVTKPAAEEGENVRKMRADVERLAARKYKTASDEALLELYGKRLAADPAKWKPGMGVSRGVMASGGISQRNRGFRVAEVDASEKMARIRQVADTGLTSSGGDNDRFEDEWVHLGDLKRDKKYDKAA